MYIDDERRAVFLVQGKYRTSERPKAEAYNDLMGFAKLASTLVASDDDFRAFLEGIDPAAREKLKISRERLLKRDYHLNLIYASTGNASDDHLKEALRSVRAVQLPNGDRAQFIFYGRQQTLALLEQYLDGTAPPVPSMDLSISGGAISYFDRIAGTQDGITTWVFWMSGDDIAELFERANVRIFNANVRGYLGSGKRSINEEILQTITNRPRYFVYANNGVTIVCDEARREGQGQNDLLNVTNPQIINGQQTTRVLAQAGALSHDVMVLARVISLPTQLTADGLDRDELIAYIVRATNRQNAVTAPDLHANDRVQVHLERRLRPRYQYIRKRMSKSEARAIGVQGQVQITKEELARAVAACDTEDLGLQGRIPLFQDYYDTIFSSWDADHYLMRYWTMRAVNGRARGSSERNWAKFVVAHYLWRQIAGDVRKKRKQYINSFEHKGSGTKSTLALEKSIDALFRGAVRFYNANKGHASNRVDVATFFKRKGIYKTFKRDFENASNPHRKAFDSSLVRFRASL